MGTDGAAQTAQAEELRVRALGFHRAMQQMTCDGAGSASLILLGEGTAEIANGLERLAPRARASVWSMQRIVQFDISARFREMDNRSVSNGLETIFLIAEQVLERNPLFTSVYSYGRIAPVFGPLMIIDRACVVVPGALSVRGGDTAWMTTRTDVVEDALDLWHRTYRQSKPALEPGEPAPLTPRQVEVARLLAQGLKDSAIARHLAVSDRTVVTEVSRILTVIGTRSRATAAAVIAGGLIFSPD